MNVQLSKRMQAVADMAVPGYRVADIGCDHGFVSIYLIQAGIAPHVYAADVRPGPLSRAKEHIRQAGLEDYITPVLSDGLAKVPVYSAAAGAQVSFDIAAADAEEKENTGAQAMIAAGIGGRLTIKILSDWIEKTKNLSWMVLEPQSDIHLVRQWLSEHGFFILKENLVYEDGKYYPVLFAANEADERWKEEIGVIRNVRKDYGARLGKVDPDADAELVKESFAAADLKEKRWEMACDLFGFDGIAKQHPVLKQYLLHTIKKEREILSGMKRFAVSPPAEQPEGQAENTGCSTGRIDQRMAEIMEKIRLCELVLELYEQ